MRWDFCGSGGEELGLGDNKVGFRRLDFKVL